MDYLSRGSTSHSRLPLHISHQSRNFPTGFPTCQSDRGIVSVEVSSSSSQMTINGHQTDKKKLRSSILNKKSVVSLTVSNQTKVQCIAVKKCHCLLFWAWTWTGRKV